MLPLGQVLPHQGQQKQGLSAAGDTREGGCGDAGEGGDRGTKPVNDEETPSVPVCLGPVLLPLGQVRPLQIEQQQGLSATGDSGKGGLGGRGAAGEGGEPGAKLVDEDTPSAPVCPGRVLLPHGQVHPLQIEQEKGLSATGDAGEYRIGGRGATGEGGEPDAKLVAA